MWKNAVGWQNGQRSRKIKLTAALGSGGIPFFRGIAKKGFLSYQMVALKTNVSPQNLSLCFLCNKYAVVHWGKFWTALCCKEKGNRFTWHFMCCVKTLVRFPIWLSFWWIIDSDSLYSFMSMYTHTPPYPRIAKDLFSKGISLKFSHKSSIPKEKKFPFQMTALEFIRPLKILKQVLFLLLKQEGEVNR